MKWKDLPVAIQEVMLQRQVDQGNPPDSNAFKKELTACKLEGGFTWENSSEGYDFWQVTLRHGDFRRFYNKYPEKENEELVFEKNTAYHCPTEEIAKELLGEAYKAGFKWNGGDSFLLQTKWKNYKENTVYYIIEGKCGGLDFVPDSYKIVNAEDFLNHKINNKQDEKIRSFEGKGEFQGGTSVRFSSCARQVTVGCGYIGNTTKYRTIKPKISSTEISSNAISYGHSK